MAYLKIFSEDLSMDFDSMAANIDKEAEIRLV